jgi:hypothetical protein
MALEAAITRCPQAERSKAQPCSRERQQRYADCSQDGAALHLVGRTRGDDHRHNRAESSEDEICLPDLPMQRKIVVPRGKVEVESTKEEHPGSAYHVRER